MSRHKGKRIVSGIQRNTLRRSDGKSAHTDNSRYKTPEEQHNTGRKECLAGRAFVGGCIDTGTVCRCTDNAHVGGENQRDCRHKTVLSQSVESHGAGFSCRLKGSRDICVSCCRRNSFHRDQCETRNDNTELNRIRYNHCQVTADKYVNRKCKHRDNLTDDIIHPRDVSQILGTAVHMVTKPDDLNHEHHKAHYLTDDLFTAVIILRFL